VSKRSIKYVTSLLKITLFNSNIGFDTIGGDGQEQLDALIEARYYSDAMFVYRFTITCHQSDPMSQIAGNKYCYTGHYDKKCSEVGRLRIKVS
jgi:hypothetical protein